MKERHKAVPASYLILKKGNDILLGHRINTGYYDGWYTVPAGHIEAGELPLEALARESDEEIGISFDKKDAHLIHTMYRAKHDETGERADYFFLVEKWQNEPKNMEPNKCDELRWFSLDNLPNNLMRHVEFALEAIKNDINYSEIPFSESFMDPNNK